MARKFDFTIIYILYSFETQCGHAESSLPQHIEMSAHDNRNPARFEWRDRPIAQDNVSELIATLQQQVFTRIRCTFQPNRPRFLLFSKVNRRPP